MSPMASQILIFLFITIDRAFLGCMASLPMFQNTFCIISCLKLTKTPDLVVNLLWNKFLKWYGVSQERVQGCMPSLPMFQNTFVFNISCFKLTKTPDLGVNLLWNKFLKKIRCFTRIDHRNLKSCDWKGEWSIRVHKS